MRGWRIDRVPNTNVLRGADGRISVPLWLLHDGTYHSGLSLTLSPAEAEVLHAQLCYALDAVVPASAVTSAMPDCRKPVRGQGLG